MVTFLCKACNSFLGTAYEGHVSALQATIEESKATGATTLKITLSNPGGVRLHLDGIFSGSKEDRRLETRSRGRNKQAEERWAAERKGGGPMLLTFRSPPEQLVKLAFLAWAHLLFFRHLGYAYVFTRAGRLARQALLSGSTQSLNRAFFFTYGDYGGLIEPTKVGMLMRSEEEPVRALPTALGAQVGDTVIALPLGGRAAAAYEQLPEFAVDEEVVLGVVTFEDLYHPRGEPLAARVAYRWKSADGTIDPILDEPDARADLDQAKRPPRSRPKGRPYPSNSAWPPLKLHLPEQPRTETWRAAAAEWLEARGLEVSMAAAVGDADWVAMIAAVDEVAGFHMEDMRNVFGEGADPKEFAEPAGMRVMDELNQIVAEHDRNGRVIGGEFSLILPGEDYGSLAIRVVSQGRDLVIGPFYTYQTLVRALRRALTSSPAAH